MMKVTCAEKLRINNAREHRNICMAGDIHHTLSKTGRPPRESDLVDTSCYPIMVYPLDSVPNHNPKLTLR